MPPVTFSSDSLPASLDDAARFRVWRDRYMEHHGQLDVSRADHRPFSLRFTAAQYGSVMVGQFTGTVSSVARTPHHIAASPSDTCCIVLNRGRSHMSFSHDGGEGALEAQTAALFLGAEPADLYGGGDNKVMFISIARNELAELVSSPQDLAGVPFDARDPTTRYLMRYLTMLSELDEADQGSALGSHIGTTLLDLAALALGATRDGTQRAGMRGLRAARAQDIIARIACSFTDPMLSPTLIAREARFLHALRAGLAAGNRHAVHGARARTPIAARTFPADRCSQRSPESERDRIRLRL